MRVFKYPRFDRFAEKEGITDTYLRDKENPVVTGLLFILKTNSVLFLFMALQSLAGKILMKGN